MKHLFVLLIAVSASVLHAQSPKVEAVIAEGQDSKPATAFAPDAPKLYAFFRSEGTHAGDKLRGVWIADDVGNAAPKGTTIDQTTLTADSDNFYGAFSLTKPTKGWPAGKYHVDIILNDKLAVSPEFTITDATKEKEDTGEKDGDSENN
ncbi:MAG: hypothetical protein JO025_01100 [Verrucomicrobia bacterium]|nr:hypothetical protein [Verrucomicrobiota bacterium]